MYPIYAFGSLEQRNKVGLSANYKLFFFGFSVDVTVSGRRREKHGVHATDFLQQGIKAVVRNIVLKRNTPFESAKNYI